MNKRIKFLISAVLIFAIFVSSFILPASSYETGVETSTADMLLVNLDTDTVVFSQKPDNMWYAGYLSELVTFLVAYELIDKPEEVTYQVEKDFSSSLPHKDGCLNPYVDKELTAKDLMAIMILTSGNDAAYALADLASGGDRAAFVTAMNDKVKELGCKNTGFVSPGYDNTSDQYTTCRDLYTIYMKLRENQLFNEIMSARPLRYIPESLVSEDQDENEAYTVKPEASILNESSPYYFRYTNDGKYSHTDATYANMVVTTTYRGKTYFFAGLLGLNESEKNVYADAKKLTTWAYLNLSDYKMINSDVSVTQIKVTTDWGEYSVGLHPSNSAFKTLPNDYDEKKVDYKFNIPESVKVPIAEGQSVGGAKISYDGNEIGEVQLNVTSDEGISMLPDMGRFSTYVLKQLTPREPSTEATEAQEEKSGETKAPGTIEKAQSNASSSKTMED